MFPPATPIAVVRRPSVPGVFARFTRSENVYPADGVTAAMVRRTSARRSGIGTRKHSEAAVGGLAGRGPSGAIPAALLAEADLHLVAPDARLLGRVRRRRGPAAHLPAGPPERATL